MNRTFKTIFNKTRGTYMVADENARAHGKTKSVATAVTVALAGALLAGPVMADQTKIEKQIWEENVNIENKILENYTLKDNENKIAPIIIKEDGSFMIKGSTFKDNSNATGIHKDTGLTYYKYNTEKIGSVNPLSSVGAVYIETGARGDVIDTTFVGNKHPNVNQMPGDRTAGAILNDGILRIGGTISEAFSVTDFTTDNINGTTVFDSNYSNFRGGAVNNHLNGQLIVSNAVFKNNYTGARGGAIMNYGVASDSGSIYYRNYSGSGGVLYNVSDSYENTYANSPYGTNPAPHAKASFTANGDYFLENGQNADGKIKVSHAGAIYNAGGIFRDSNSFYIRNKANYSGGAIRNGEALSSDAELYLSNDYFEGNEATLQGGGAIYNYAKNTATVTSSQFYKNKSGKDGGPSSILVPIKVLVFSR